MLDFLEEIKELANEHKFCRYCKNFKLTTEFYSHPSTKDRLSNKCKKCTKIYDRLYEKTDKGKISHRRSKIKRQYGVSLEKYDEMLNKQNGKCAICKSKYLTKYEKRNDKYLCIDHDKITNKLRGLLCPTCNLGIGHLKHNIEILKQAIEYLKNYA